MKKTLLAAALALASTSVFAQAPSGEWKGSMSLGASYAKSYAGIKNTNFNIAGEASRATAADKLAVYGIALFGNTKNDVRSVDSADSLKAGARYEWNLSPQAYAFGSLDLERDGIIGLDMRAALGLGAGYYFVKSDPLTFTVFGGVSQRVDKFDGGSDNFTELLIGEESNHKLSSTTTFKQRLVAYPNLSESGEFRAAFDATLSMAIAGAWNMNLSLVHRHDSMLPSGNKNDTGFFVGVGAKFGK